VNEALPKVQLRNKNKVAEPVEKKPDESINGMAQNALERAMTTIYEPSPEMDDNNDGNFWLKLNFNLSF
jgi:hypothetical protein